MTTAWEQAYIERQRIRREKEKAIEEERKRREEENARKHTFNLGSLLPALVAAPFTGGGSLMGTLGSFAANAAPMALGEAYRASQGSDVDYGTLADTSFKAARKLRGYAPVESGKNMVTRNMQGASQAPGSSPPAELQKPSFMSDLVGGMGAATYEPPSQERQKQNELIASGKVKPKSFTQDGTSYTEANSLEDEKTRAEINYYNNGKGRTGIAGLSASESALVDKCAGKTVAEATRIVDNAPLTHERRLAVKAQLGILKAVKPTKPGKKPGLELE